jgi:alcohol dehydrogenase class IV
MMLDPGHSFNLLPVPTDVHFGYGALKSLPGHLRSQNARRVLLVTDPGVRAAGLVARVTNALEEAGVEVTIYDQVTADSGSTLIGDAVDCLKACGAEVVVGVGGGSSLDTAKAAAALATNPGSPQHYLGLHKAMRRPLPLIAIPTTAGTGSEVSLWSVFTDDSRKLKVAIGGVAMYPSIAVCDPELTFELPAALTAATGMDALAHAIECCTNTACQPISAALAFEAIALIGAHLPTAARNGHDREARYAMMLASTMAGMAMNSTRLGLAHALAMPLGSWDLKIPHGIAIAVTLPLVMEFNIPAAPERFASVARALGEEVDDCSTVEAASRAVSAVARLSDAIGIPKGLSTYGLQERHVPAVVEEAMKSGNVVVNPRPTSKAQLAEILRRAR